MSEGFVKGEVLRLLKTISSIRAFEENITRFKKHRMERGYPQNFIDNSLSGVKFPQRTQALLQRNETKRKRILPSITQYHPAVPNLKEILTRKWYLIQQQPLLKLIFKEPPIRSSEKGAHLKTFSYKSKNV